MVRPSLFPISLVLCVSFTLTTAVVIPNQEDFVSLMEKAAKDFRAVRYGGTQYAFALLFPDDWNWNAFRYQPEASPGSNTPVIDRTRDTSPSANYGNYLAASPRRRSTGPKKDAEQMLFTALKSVVVAYKVNHRQRYPNTIVIYTYLSPCLTCAQLIIVQKQAALQIDQIRNWIVVYDHIQSGWETEFYTVRGLFRDAGITFMKLE